MKLHTEFICVAGAYEVTNVSLTSITHLHFTAI